MFVKQHFSNEQARQFGEEFGIDWEWGCSLSDQHPMGMDTDGEIDQYSPRMKPKGRAPSSRSTSSPHHSHNKRNPSAKAVGKK